MIIVKQEGVVKLDSFTKKIEQLERLLAKVDKLLYRVIQIAGTISILKIAIKAWFT